MIADGDSGMAVYGRPPMILIQDLTECYIRMAGWS